MGDLSGTSITATRGINTMLIILFKEHISFNLN